MESGGGSQQGGGGGRGWNTAATASPASPSSAVSAFDQQRQRQFLRRPEGNDAYLAYQAGNVHGVTGGFNLASSSGSMQQRNFIDLGKQQISPEQQAYLQYAIQANQQKSTMGMQSQQQMIPGMFGSLGKDQEMQMTNLKMQELIPMQASNQSQSQADHTTNLKLNHPTLLGQAIPSRTLGPQSQQNLINMTNKPMSASEQMWALALKRNIGNARQLNRLPSQSASPSNDNDVGNPPTSQDGLNNQMLRSHNGFAKEQLLTLKAQIHSFRCLKKGERLPRELLQGIVPPPIDLQVQQVSTPHVTTDKDISAGENEDEHAQHMYSSEKVLQTVKPPTAASNIKEGGPGDGRAGPSTVRTDLTDKGKGIAPLLSVSEGEGETGELEDNEFAEAPSASSRKLVSLSALYSRPITRPKKLVDELEEGETAVSGDSPIDHAHDVGEDVKIKRKRSIRLQPQQMTESLEEKHSAKSSQFPFQVEREGHAHNVLRDSSSLKMSEVTQRKCKTIIRKIQRRIDKEGGQIIPMLTSLWEKMEHSSGSTDNLDFRKINLRLEKFEYAGVVDFVSDVHLMLKRGMQHYGFAREVRSEAKQVYDLLFKILKTVFPGMNLREIRISILGVTTTLVAGSSSRYTPTDMEWEQRLNLEEGPRPLLVYRRRGRA